MRQVEAAKSSKPKATRKGWRAQLRRTRTGEVVSCTSNVFLILANDPAWQGVLAFNSLTSEIVTLKPPPWPVDMLGDAKAVAGHWADADTVKAVIWLTRAYGTPMDIDKVSAALGAAARLHTVHPVRDWLVSLKWDGARRLDTWLTDIGGAEDTPYTRAVASKFLIGAVARAFVPGAKVDSMPVFEGDQGIGKSTMLSILFGEQWFMETSVKIGTKDSYQVLRGKWGCEFGEMDAYNRSELTELKCYISARVDTYRASYGRISEDHPRSIVFAGTTNLHEYLKDDTGARRFWPIRLHGRIDTEQLSTKQSQLWAEAVERYQKGEAWHMSETGLLQQAAEIAAERRQIDPWEGPVADWLSCKDEKFRATGVTSHEIMVGVLGISLDKATRADEMRTAQVLRSCGWGDRVRLRKDGRIIRVFRPDAAVEVDTVVTEVVTPKPLN